MRFAFLRPAFVAAVALLSAQARAQNANNPIQLALLRWYQANTVTQFSTCGLPQGLAFDGAHIWVACGNGFSNGNTLEEYNASDGKLLQTVSPVGNPYALVYDGANIWASNNSSSTVTEVNAATGLVVGSPIAVGSNPKGMAFDGTYVWVANNGTSGTISKILATTGAVTTYTFPALTCSHPFGILFDGTSIWVACNFSNTVIQVNPSTGALVQQVTPGCNYPTFLAYDGGTSPRCSQRTSGLFLTSSPSTVRTCG